MDVMKMYEAYDQNTVCSSIYYTVLDFSVGFFSWICCLEKQNIDNKNCQENGEMAKCCKVVS